ncbi:hypothetical protein [Helicobacter sp. MIT 99-5507]|nr:hypothetical protein [Helicobacter sp. MIT 99-5507]
MRIIIAIFAISDFEQKMQNGIRTINLKVNNLDKMLDSLIRERIR